MSPSLRGRCGSPLLTGVVSALATLTVLDASLPGGFIEGSGDMGYARTMAFTTQVFISLLPSLARGPMIAALSVGCFQISGCGARSGCLLVSNPGGVHAVSAEGVFDDKLSLADWVQCTAVASSVVWLRELSKVVVRDGGERRQARLGR